MTDPGIPGPFFVAGGTLDPLTPSYVERLADAQLRNLTASGQLAYMLTSRQVGKSSMMERTAAFLRQQGIQTVIIDLNGLGEVTVAEWYGGLLYTLADKLNLKSDALAWSEAHSALSWTHRFTTFIRDVLPNEVTAPVVVFFDEIDSLLKFNFADEFFAAIRSLHGFRLVSFVLIGSATPGDLIRDPGSTPFNVGERIELSDFEYEQVHPLVDGLAVHLQYSGFDLSVENLASTLDEHYMKQARQIIRWVLDWTGGHPYLTQRLCRAIVDEGQEEWTRQDVANLVERVFLGVEGGGDGHMAYIRNMLTRRPESDSPEALKDYHDRLTLYRDVYHADWRKVRPDDRPKAQAYLRLIGIVKVSEGGLKVRNRIYRRVFDQRWVSEQLSGKGSLRTLPPLARRAALTITLLFVLLAAAAGWAGRSALLARERSQIALARQLTLRSSTLLDSQYDVALLLGLEAWRSAPNTESEAAVRHILNTNPYLIAYLRDHQDPVTSVALTRDARLLASADDSGQVTLWNVDERRPLDRALAKAQAAVHDLAFDSDTQRLFAAGCANKQRGTSLCTGGSIAMWHLDEDDIVPRAATGHDDAIQRLTLSPDGHRLVTVGGHQLILWDADTLEILWQLPTPAALYSADFHPFDAGLLAFGDDEGVLRLVDLAERRILYEATTRAGRIRDIDFDTSGRSLAAAGENGTITLWDNGAWSAPARRLTGHTDAVLNVEYGTNGRLLSAGRDGRLYVWQTADPGAPRLELRGHTGVVQALATAGQDILVSSGPAGSIILWNLAGDPGRSRLIGQAGNVAGLDFSPDGSRLATAGEDGRILLWDVARGRRVGRPLIGHTGAVQHVAFQPGGRYIASAGSDHKVMLWDLTAPAAAPLELAGHEAGVRGVAFSADGRLLASSDDAGHIRVWDVTTGQPLYAEFQASSREVSDVAFSPDGRLLASGSRDGIIRFWDATGGQAAGVSVVTGLREIWDIAFSPDGATLAAAGAGDTVPLIDVATRIVSRRLLTSQLDRIHTIAFSPDGRLLASGSADKTITIWTVAEPAVGLRLGLHDSEVVGLAFSNDSQLLASSGAAGAVFISHVRFDTPVPAICGIAGRDLSVEEWRQYVGPDVPYRSACD